MSKQKKKAYTEVTLYSVCEVKEFGQVTVAKDYKHTSHMVKCNFVLQELSLLISIVTLWRSGEAATFAKYTFTKSETERGSIFTNPGSFRC